MTSSRGWAERTKPFATVATRSPLDLGVDGDFDVDFKRDILSVGSLDELGGPFDFVWASPPCTAFSVAAMGKNWEKVPGKKAIARAKTAKATLGMAIAEHTFALVDAYRDLHPATLYVIENPVGALRVMPFTIERRDRDTTWYCQWGDVPEGEILPRAKPTDLWNNLVGPWPACRQGSTDHLAAPRGAKTGTQGLKNAASRSLVPYLLSKAACFAGEMYMAGGLPLVERLTPETESTIRDRVPWKGRNVRTDGTVTYAGVAVGNIDKAA